MPARPFTTLEDQSATFVELFFDLVFVFAVTQVVSLLAHDLTWPGLGHSILVFWLVWWGWTQYTWALNTADTTHPSVEVGVLVATGFAFLMAVVIPDAFSSGSSSFAFAYVAVRGVGFALYARVTWGDAAKRQALWRFALPSMSGLAAVIVGGLAAPDVRVWWWAAAILLDLVAAGVGGQSEGWDIRPEHFSERHGLFVIIALGESLIVAAVGLSGAERTGPTVAVAVLAVTIACGLWWTYFACTKPQLDRALAEHPEPTRAPLARDVYSVLHFLVIFGVVLVAVGIEEAVAHPSDPLRRAGLLALASGVVLFVGGSAAALLRATRRLAVPRLGVLALMSAAAVTTADATAPWQLAVITVALGAVVVFEREVHTR